MNILAGKLSRREIGTKRNPVSNGPLRNFRVKSGAQDPVVRRRKRGAKLGKRTLSTPKTAASHILSTIPALSHCFLQYSYSLSSFFPGLFSSAPLLSLFPLFSVFPLHQLFASPSPLLSSLFLPFVPARSIGSLFGRAKRQMLSQFREQEEVPQSAHQCFPSFALLQFQNDFALQVVIHVYILVITMQSSKVSGKNT